MPDASVLKPRALRRGDRVAIVAPASPFPRDEFQAGVEEIRRLGFEPVFDDSVFDRVGYTAGEAASRAAAVHGGVAGPGRGRGVHGARRVRQRRTASVPVGPGVDAEPEAPRRLQRRHGAVELPDHAMRHDRASRSNRRRRSGTRPGGLRSGLARACADERRTDRRAGRSCARGHPRPERRTDASWEAISRSWPRRWARRTPSILRTDACSSSKT